MLSTLSLFSSVNSAQLLLQQEFILQNEENQKRHLNFNSEFDMYDDEVLKEIETKLFKALLQSVCSLLHFRYFTEFS